MYQKMSDGGKSYDEKLNRRNTAMGLLFKEGDQGRSLSHLNEVGKQLRAFSSPGQAPSGSQPLLSWFITGPLSESSS